jgi:D-alanyl-D-alanine carboxypeptidase
MPISTHHSKTLFYILIFGSIFLLIYSIFLYSNFVFAEDQVRLTPTLSTEEEEGQFKTEPIIEKLVAKSYIIYDINSNKLIKGENTSSPLPLASLTKVITVATLLEAAKNASTTVRDQTKLIIKKALVSSSNEDAEALGYTYSYSFGGDLVTASNQFLKEKLNIQDVNIVNLTGLDNFDGVNLSASNTGSAESMAKIFAYVYEHHREIFEYTRTENVETEIGTLKNTNKISDNTFGIMASKTGFTWQAGGNLGIIISPSPGESYVVLVMGSTKEGRFKDMEKLTKILPYITE